MLCRTCNPEIGVCLSMVMIVMAMIMAVVVIMMGMVPLARPVAQLLEDRHLDAHGAFDLQGRVGYVVVAGQQVLDPPQYHRLPGFVCRFDVHMRRQVPGYGSRWSRY